MVGITKCCTLLAYVARAWFPTLVVNKLASVLLCPVPFKLLKVHIFELLFHERLMAVEFSSDAIYFIQEAGVVLLDAGVVWRGV